MVYDLSPAEEWKTLENKICDETRSEPLMEGGESARKPWRKAETDKEGEIGEGCVNGDIDDRLSWIQMNRSRLTCLIDISRTCH